MNRTRLAKAAFWLSGKLRFIREYRRFYVVTNVDVEKGIFDSEPGGRHWTENRVSMKLLRISMTLDPEHWDHWALVHENCRGYLCECGGYICDPEDEEEDR